VQLANYFTNDLSFVDFSTYIAEMIYSNICKSDKLDSIDFILCDFCMENERKIALMEFTNKIGFTHQVINDEDGIKNDIIKHYAILPNPSQKIDEYALIDINSLNIKFNDKKRCIDGIDTFIIPDVILECSTNISPKETVKLVNSITKTIAENYGQNSVLAISKAKNYIIENIDTSEDIEPFELGKEVFSSSQLMQDDFIKEVKNAGIPETVRIDKSFAIRTGRNHKIKTDTGIEISIPVDYFQNKEYVEFTNNPDGTLSIELKNIGKITNR
jgi:hypothetical protein